MPVLRRQTLVFLSGAVFAPTPFDLALAALASAVIATSAWRLKALNAPGAAASFFIGVLCLGVGGLIVGVPLFVFFASGSLLSRAPRPRCSTYGTGQAKGPIRDAVQVLANGGAAAACCAIAGVLAYRAPSLAPPWYGAAIGALAVAAADTWATEIGMRSKAAVRSIVTGAEVLVGMSGGVTLLGFTASLLGGASIGASAAAFVPGMPFAAWAWACGAVGFAGATLDSLLGATFQAQWRCDACGVPCETALHRCGARAQFVHGLPWLDNDGVNAASTVAGAALGYLVSLLAG